MYVLFKSKDLIISVDPTAPRSISATESFVLLNFMSFFCQIVMLLFFKLLFFVIPIYFNPFFPVFYSKHYKILEDIELSENIDT